MRFLKSRDCYSRPQDVYRVAKARGMDLVTITDHDSIGGCLEYLDRNPGATDFFSYRIPALRFEGEPLVWYAAWRSHTSLYPIGEDITKKHAAATRRYKTAKGTIQFPLSEPPPVDLIKRLIQARIAQIRAKARDL